MSAIVTVTDFCGLGIPRDQFMRSGLDRTATVLELGPLNMPVVSEIDCREYFTLDVAPKTDLVKNRRLDSVEAGKVRDPDFIAPDGDIPKSIGQTHLSYFDFIVSSHNIEHIPDPLHYLNDLSMYLSPRGILRIAAPDMRGIFDFFRPPTSLGQWIQAFVEKPKFHSIAALFDSRAYATINKGSIGWHQAEDLSELATIHPLGESYGEAVRMEEAYRDAHAWTFTPMSFVSLIYEANSLGLLSLAPTSLATNQAHEFYVDLVKSPALPLSEAERIYLRKAAAKEMASAFARVI